MERLVGERVGGRGRDFYSRPPSAVAKSGRSHSCRLCLVSLQEKAVLNGKLASLKFGGEHTGKIGGGVGKEVEDDFTLQLELDGLSCHSALIGMGHKDAALGLLLRLWYRHP